MRLLQVCVYRGRGCGRWSKRCTCASSTSGNTDKFVYLRNAACSSNLTSVTLGRVSDVVAQLHNAPAAAAAAAARRSTTTTVARTISISLRRVILRSSATYLTLPLTRRSRDDRNVTIYGWGWHDIDKVTVISRWCGMALLPKVSSGGIFIPDSKNSPHTKEFYWEHRQATEKTLHDVAPTSTLHCSPQMSQHKANVCSHFFRWSVNPAPYSSTLAWRAFCVATANQSTFRHLIFPVFFPASQYNCLYISTFFYLAVISKAFY